MQNGIFLFLMKNKVSKKRSILDPLQDKKKLADPDPITCDPGSRVHDPDPEAVIPDPIYLVTTLSLAPPRASAGIELLKISLTLGPAR